MGKDSKLNIEGWKIVAVFVVVLFAYFGCEAARADSSVFVEAGGTVLSGETSKGVALILGQEFGRWELSGGYVSYQICRCNYPEDLEPNIFVQGQRVVELGPTALGIGMAYFQNTNRALGKNLTWSLMMQWNVNDRLALQFRHWSNAGSGKPNLGQDLISIAYRFGDL